MAILTTLPRHTASRISIARISIARISIALVSVALLTACSSSDTTAPSASCAVTPPNGTVTASVNGEPWSATLIAQATIQNTNQSGPNIVQVNGVSCPTTLGAGGRQILFTIGRLTPITPGTYRVDAAAQLQPPQSGYSGIGLVALAPNLWYGNLSDGTGAGSGSITFTTVSATRLAGTFQLVAVAAGSNATSAQQRVTVTNGAFDVSVP